MIQSIKLMALPLQELKEQIQEEIEANPALEIVEDRSTISLETLPENEGGDGEVTEAFENSSDPGFASRSGAADDSKRMFIEGAIARPETLQEHLLWQLRLQPLDEELRSLGESIIQNLSDDGFHKESPYILKTGVDESVVDGLMA
jgi:RNA polymerase sigma-54 factor